jgi:hypothetical protein
MSTLHMAVDSRGTAGVRTGTAVESSSGASLPVDGNVRRPPSVLTPTTVLTCDDARRPQFPQALLLPRVLSYEGQSFIESVDDERRLLP